MDNPKDGVRPFIRIYTKYRSICVNLAAHDILGKPPYLEFYWNSEKKIFFISPLREAKAGCYIVSTQIFNSRKNEIKIQETPFFNGLMGKLCWQNGMCYKVYGYFAAEYNMLGFDMSNPIIMGSGKNESASL